MRQVVITLCFLASTSAAAVADVTRAADQPPPTHLYQKRCGQCHPPMGDFVSDNLVIKEGQLRTKRGSEEVMDFLRSHRGGIAVDEAARLYRALWRQVSSEHAFQRRCRICHQRASVLAERTLIVRDGRLFGRYTARDMQEFLKGHGRATVGEAAELYRTLERHAPRAR